jgi:CAAX protease family protein
MMDGDPATNHDVPLILTDADYFPPSAAVEFAPSATSKARPRPWGPWATIGWTLLCLASMIAVQIGVLVAFMVAGAGSVTGNLLEVTSSSLFLSTSTLTSTPIVIGLVAILVYARGCPIREYLALRMPTARQASLAVAGLAILLAVGDSVTHLLGRPIVPQVMVDIYQTGWFSLLLPTLLVAAPLGEETLMRGFLYQGIASRWGALAAVLVSSVAWALLHLQYDWYGIVQIALMGIYLGEVRRRSASLPLTILLHGIANAVATIEMMTLVHLRGG